jgi:hypothetical protein
MSSRKPQEFAVNSPMLTDLNVEKYFESIGKGKASQKAKPHEFEINLPLLSDLKVEESLNGCVGFFNCSEPGKCGDYELCLRKCMNGEERNETLKL